MAFTDFNKLPLNCIVIDTRESPKRIKQVKIVAQTIKMNFKEEALETGDYLSTYGVLELKSGSDFATSLQSGRLMNQMHRLSEMPQPVKGLLVTGRLINRKYTKIHPNAIVGAMSSIASRGISVLRTTSKAEEAQLICRFLQKANKHKGEWK